MDKELSDKLKTAAADSAQLSKTTEELAATARTIAYGMARIANNLLKMKVADDKAAGQKGT